MGEKDGLRTSTLIAYTWVGKRKRGKVLGEAEI